MQEHALCSPGSRTSCTLSACRQVGPTYHEKLFSNPQDHIFALNRLFSAAVGAIRTDDNTTRQSDAAVEEIRRFCTASFCRCDRKKIGLT